MRIRRVFDIIGPRGFIPNGINWNNTSIMWDYNFYVDHDFTEKFNSIYTQVSVYDCNLNIGTEYISDIHIGALNYDSNKNVITNNPSENFYYTIHPFGNSGISTGIDISYHEGKHCFDFISKKAIEYSKAKNFYFIFDYSSEGCIQSSIFEKMHEACNRNNINPSKVIVITSAMNTTDVYQEYIKENNPSKLLYTAFYPWSVMAKSKDTNEILFQNSIIDFNGNQNENSLMTESELDTLTDRSKKSLCLNRRLAPHRLIAISYLINEGLFDETLTSFDIKMLYTPDAGFDVVNGGGFDGEPYMKDQDFINNIVKGFRTLVKKEKNVLDYDNIADVWGFGFESSALYKETYFSITTETLFYEQGDYISEKTFKPIAHLHPFVFMGRPGVLKYLQDLGLKTFGEFWDESYDDVTNNFDRMELTLKVIKTLISKSNEEWDELNKKIKSILIHNRNHLLSFDGIKTGNTYIKNLTNLINNEPNKENYHLL